MLDKYCPIWVSKKAAKAPEEDEYDGEMNEK